MMRVVVVTPTYNERQNLAAVPGTHILIVDDNSPDATGQLAEELAGKHVGTVFVLHRPGKAGLGRAYVAGFKQALASGYDVMVQMDADLSHPPRHLPRMLARLATCDLVFGSRYMRGINVVNWDFRRLLLSKMASFYVRMITRMPFSDATRGFKCWRRDALETIGLDRVFSNGYLFQVEMTYRSYCAGLRIKETFIIFYERSTGRSKMNWSIAREAVVGVVRLRLLRMFNRLSPARR